MKNDRIRAILLFFWVVLTIVMNVLANVIPIGGQTTGQVFERYPTLITPAGYAFSIWTLIYAGLVGFAVYQALPQQQRSERLRAIRGPLLVNVAANVAWILAWHHDHIFLSLIAIALMTDSLATSYARLDGFPVRSRAEFWLVRVPISTYLAWTIVATVVTCTVFLVSLGHGVGDAASLLAVAALAVVASICGVIVLRRQDWAFTLTTLWALTAIAVNQAGTPVVAAAALIAASLIALAKTIGYLRQPGSGRVEAGPAASEFPAQRRNGLGDALTPSGRPPRPPAPSAPA